MNEKQKAIQDKVDTWNAENKYPGDIREQRERKLFLIKPTKGDWNKAVKRAKKGDSIYLIST